MAGQYEGGLTSAINSRSERDAQAVTNQHLAQLMDFRARLMQQEAIDRAQAAQYQANAGRVLPGLAGAFAGPPPGVAAPFAGPPEMMSALQAPSGPPPQAPMPGEASVPMMPPGAPPPMGAEPSMPPDGTGGAPPSSLAAAPESQAAPMPDSWQPSPVATPELGGNAGPDAGMASGNVDQGVGLPPPMPKIPAPLLSMPVLISAMQKANIPQEQMLGTLKAMKPMIDHDNDLAIKMFEANVRADKAGEEARRREFEAQTKRLNVEGANARRGESAAQGWAKLDLGRDTLAAKVAGTIGKQANNAAAAGTLKLADDEELRRFMAQRLWAGDRTVLQNLGRGAQGAENILALNREAMKVGREMGKGADDLAVMMAEFEGLKAGERAVGTRTAGIEVAATEAKEIAPLAIEASEAASRQGWKVFNDIQQAVQKGTASQELRAFVAADNALVNIYARAVNPTGVPTVHDKEHARQMLNVGFANGDYKATVNQMMLEIDAALRSPAKVKAAMRERATGRPEGAAAPAAGAAPVKITGNAEWEKLAPGTEFIGPDGVKRRK